MSTTLTEAICAQRMALDEQCNRLANLVSTPKSIWLDDDPQTSTRILGHLDGLVSYTTNLVTTIEGLVDNAKATR
jgi:hypothetical protein